MWITIGYYHNVLIKFKYRATQLRSVFLCKEMQDENYSVRLARLETKFTISIDTLNKTMGEFKAEFKDELTKLADAIEKLSSNQGRIEAFVSQQANINNRLNSVENEVDSLKKQVIEHKEEDRDFHRRITLYMKLILWLGGVLAPIFYFVVQKLISRYL